MKHPSEREKIGDQAERLLSGLGKEPGQVAGSLVSAGVKGVPFNYFDCAIAVYLGAVIGADPRVERLTVTKAEVMIECRGWWRRAVVVSLPPAVGDFVARFDAEGFPDLLRPAAPPTPARSAEA